MTDLNLEVIKPNNSKATFINELEIPLPDENGFYHILYKTVNRKTNRSYLGMHSTKKLNDGYLGSGTLLTAAIKKYGRGEFTRYIIGFNKTRELNIQAESLLITQEIVDSDEYYNLVCGGVGGESLGKRLPEAQRKHLSELMMGRTKETHSYLIEKGKQTAERYANLSEEEKIEYTAIRMAWKDDVEKHAAANAKSAKTRTGRTKENDERVRLCAEAIKSCNRTPEANAIRFEKLSFAHSGEKNTNFGKFGEAHHGSQVTDAERLEMADLYESGLSIKQVWERFSDRLAQSTVKNIIVARWKHRERIIPGYVIPSDAKEKAKAEMISRKTGANSSQSTLSNIERLHIIELYESGMARKSIYEIYKDKTTLRTINRFISKREKIKTQLIPGYQPSTKPIMPPHQTGENNVNSKLSNIERLDIIHMFESGISRKEIAEKYKGKVGLGTIKKIIQHREKLKIALIDTVAIINN